MDVSECRCSRYSIVMSAGYALTWTWKLNQLMWRKKEWSNHTGYDCLNLQDAVMHTAPSYNSPVCCFSRAAAAMNVDADVEGAACYLGWIASRIWELVLEVLWFLWLDARLPEELVSLFILIYIFVEPFGTWSSRQTSECLKSSTGGNEDIIDTRSLYYCCIMVVSLPMYHQSSVKRE